MNLPPESIRIAQRVSLLAPLLLPSLGVSRKIGISRSGQRQRGLVGVCLGDKMNLGVVRPAIEGYADAAIEAIKFGHVIAVPTDTLYGFACDACSAKAVNHIYEIKGRKYTNPLAICVGDVHDIHKYAFTDHLPNGLLHSLLPGPVTLVLSRGESSILEKSLNPGVESIGVRVPDNNFIRVIARCSGSALALTSANLSGQASSIKIRDFENLWGHCAYIFDGGVLPARRAGSTVVDLTKQGKYKILRSGSISTVVMSAPWRKL
ncbi:unnamed protein product [Cuscuta epithymum]|uniref:Threonylcarbamoyl-AMP synthase n=1 Tax=Cuscuta epithymum TaxID=186058 RepID=A0AAV0CBE6_9ASTE|nr:unnamed protein product [Cuscuta epithymum]CAH9148546.1 unnamed protein product [Cuscuta epithymum]